ncbi:50S ribosomal protein L29 [Wenzhouxiangella sp. XN24]|uniref:50S ribosomal protein L29 n=1 Tax=Wenzhouxiangella sp. XN24 TaxID=2713569 RepID=UPI0013EE1479|nr:50S ribosomal protein L29 [Wenzhouxiangella sp. XN24]NGX16189.1 50S ribosomal protein L29 [Wenzhouxiangella sp. XN24]
MEAKDLRGKTPVELKEELLKLRREQFNLRMQRATGQMARPDQFGKVRKDIARVKTVLGEKSRDEAKGKA